MEKPRKIKMSIDLVHVFVYTYLKILINALLVRILHQTRQDWIDSDSSLRTPVNIAVKHCKSLFAFFNFCYRLLLSDSFLFEENFTLFAYAHVFHQKEFLSA